jgi:hypothetical protein
VISEEITAKTEREDVVDIDEARFIESQRILRHLGRIFDRRPKLNPQSLEITFNGTRGQIEKAAGVLERSEIWYVVDWRHQNEEPHPFTITVQIDLLFLEKQK